MEKAMKQLNLNEESCVGGNKTVPVRIVRPEYLEQEMTVEIKEAAELTCLPPTAVRVLLHAFKWDKAKMLEQTKYGESFTHLRDIGIIIRPVKSVNPGVPTTLSPLKRRNGACLICRKITNVVHMVYTSCDHWFCNRCFQRHLMSEVQSGGTSHFQCPHSLCLMLLDDDLVLNTLPPHLMHPYMKLCLEDFISFNKFRKSCPTEGCNRTWHLDVDLSSKCQKVKCDCGTNYCFGCSKLWHYPTSCEQYSINNNNNNWDLRL